jgi:hypothetical protein
MGRACSMHDSYEKCVRYFGWKNLSEETHSEDVDVDGKMSWWILGDWFSLIGFQHQIKFQFVS